MKCPICKAEFKSKPLKEWVHVLTPYQDTSAQNVKKFSIFMMQRTKRVLQYQKEPDMEEMYGISDPMMREYLKVA